MPFRKKKSRKPKRCSIEASDDEEDIEMNFLNNPQEQEEQELLEQPQQQQSQQPRQQRYHSSSSSFGSTFEVEADVHRPPDDMKSDAEDNGNENKPKQDDNDDDNIKDGGDKREENRGDDDEIDGKNEPAGADAAAASPKGGRNFNDDGDYDSDEEKVNRLDASDASDDTVQRNEDVRPERNRNVINNDDEIILEELLPEPAVQEVEARASLWSRVTTAFFNNRITGKCFTKINHVRTKNPGLFAFACVFYATAFIGVVTFLSYAAYENFGSNLVSGKTPTSNETTNLNNPNNNDTAEEDDSKLP